MGKESGGDSAEVLGEAFFKERKAELEQRVSKKRFTHVMGVVEEAEILARAYGVDVREARLAGLLHDWDKAYDDEEIRERVRELGLQVNPWILEHQPRLLHGPTAAAALGRCAAHQRHHIGRLEKPKAHTAEPQAPGNTPNARIHGHQRQQHQAQRQHEQAQATEQTR